MSRGVVGVVRQKINLFFNKNSEFTSKNVICLRQLMLTLPTLICWRLNCISKNQLYKRILPGHDWLAKLITVS